MKNHLLYFPVLLLGCSYPSQTSPLTDSLPVDSTTVIHREDTLLYFPDTIPQGDYIELKKEAIRIKEESLARWSAATTDDKDKVMDSVRFAFTALLVNRILPHWYGTTWDFNGYTETPKKGEIACGYLVSTSLRDTGIKLNRFKMAQQSAWSEAKTICGKEAIRMYSSNGKTMEEIMKEWRDDLQEGLYLLGLDNHVGYLYYREGLFFFIHSNYYTLEVMAERAEDSYCIESSVYCIAPITHCDRLLLQWMKGQTVSIVMD